MSSKHVLEDRFVVGVDVAKYSGRNTRRQLGIQEDLDYLLNEASGAAGLNRKRWNRQPTGDGEIAVLPHPVDLIRVVRGLVAELDLLLTDFNDDRAPETQIRLRLAMHIDPVSPAPFGYAGPALVVLSRLLDAAPVRDALTRHPDVNLALIISESVYEKAVTSEMGGMRPAQFEAVSVDIPAKAFRETAYLYVPGHHGDGRRPGPANPEPPSPGPASPVGDSTSGDDRGPARSSVFIVSDSVNVNGDLFGGGKPGDSR